MISYAIACMLIVLIMQMVGEMASGEIVLGKKSGGSAELGSLLPMQGNILVHGQGLQ